MKFIKVDYSVNARSTIKGSLKKEQLSAKWHRELYAKKRKNIMKIQKRKDKQLKKEENNT